MRICPFSIVAVINDGKRPSRGSDTLPGFTNSLLPIVFFQPDMTVSVDD